MNNNNKSTTTNGNGTSQQNSGRRRLSSRFLVVTTVGACLAAYGAGRLCRHQVLEHVVGAASLLKQQQQQQQPPLPPSQSSLPHPEIPSHKMPQTVYTSKQFVKSRQYAQSNSILAKMSPEEPAAATIEVATDGVLKDVDDVIANAASEEEIYKPSGQHLLIDMINVDPQLLGSQKWLAHALVELIRSSGLTMLSYHCHDILSNVSKNNSTHDATAVNENASPVLTGVVCVGVLLESHVAIRTWPAHQVLVMDLFTCGEGDLRPLIPAIEKLFSNKNATTTATGEPAQEPHILQWAYKKRGFPYGEDDATDKTVSRNPESVDGEAWVFGSMDCELKEEVTRMQTKFQEVEIYDLLQPRFRTYEKYQRSLSADGSYYAEHPEFYKPDRILYLDNVMQSRRYGEAAYHEALVHPSMFAHKNPRRVAIIGGGEGATLREVLKHKTVEKVVMIEIDKEMVDLSRKYLKEWSDCSKIVDSAPSCFDNERAEVLYIDAVGWFLEHFGQDKDVEDENLFDVIIMDALDPSSIVEFSDTLYRNKEFIAALYNSLTDDGIIVSQIGEEVSYTDAADNYTLGGSSLIAFETLVEEQGFERLKKYTESHGNFLAPWSFMSIWMDMSTGEHWYGSQAQVDYRIRQRILPTTDGSEPLHFFDGATMMSYQFPSRVNEEVFCRRKPTPPMCEEGHGINPLRKNAPISTFEVRPSKLPNAGRGVFFKEPVPKDTYVAVEQAVHDIVVYPFQKRLFQEVANASSTSLFKPFEFYLFGYGFASDNFGDAAYSVDVSILTFLNHGCNGNYIMGEKYSVTEMNADPKKPPPDFEDSTFETVFSSPFADRNLFLYMNGADTTVRDVEADEELLDNYLRYLHEENWEWGINSYRRQCEGQAGVITDYEGSETPIDPVI